MAVIDLTAPQGPRFFAGSWRLPHVRFGTPVLTAGRVRAWRRFAAAVAVLTMLAGCLVSIHTWHHAYDLTFGWAAIGVYLSISTLAQLLAVLPTIRLYREIR